MCFSEIVARGFRRWTGSLRVSAYQRVSARAERDLGELTIVPPPVVPPPATWGTATDVGTIGTQVQTIAGTLDLSSQENVDLYKITLGPGHFWRLGVELDAQRIDSNLRGALTLFDGQGNVLATRDAGTGLPSYPADPYLFQ